MTDQPETAQFDAASRAEAERMVEALLFASAEPVATAELARRLPEGTDVARALDDLRARYEGRGVELRRSGDAWAFRTAPDLGHLLERHAVETRKLSRAATETLAIIAYHQPVTRAEIEEVRGVSVSRGTVDQLIDMGWVRLGRRKMTPGRPVTFVVTEGFLDHFGLSSPRDLPGLRELRAAGLLDNRPPPGQGGEQEDAQQQDSLFGA
ncbi:MAG: SMC-Scp complex subunit ScpB [Limimaricola sp.]